MERNEKKKVCSTFKHDLEQFVTNVHELIDDAGLSTKREFLEKIAYDVNQLYESSIQVQKIQDEEAGEIGAIVQNIFVQTLSIKTKERVSIKKAVESFEPEKETESDLSFIMREYVSHPETTKSFVRELELLSDEVDTILRHIA
ncbi:MAG: hypothetical protein K1060chlam2_00454 [Chlamydiae bacterium]|nr:hypothetical protein [Chlamydiota bacterium]